MKNVKKIPYTLAAGLMIGAYSVPTMAAPISGISQVSSMGDGSGAAAPIAGLSLALSNAYAGDQEAETPTVSESGVQAVASEEITENGYSNIAIAQVSDYVNVRGAAGEDGDVVGKLYNNAAATVEAVEGDWVKITSGNCSGYVKTEFVEIGNAGLVESVASKVATVNTDGLRIRENADGESGVVELLNNGQELGVIDDSTAASGWVKVATSEGEGYVSSDYVTISTKFTTAETLEEEQARIEAEIAKSQAEAASGSSSESTAASSSSSSSSYTPASVSNGSAVVSFASQFVGNPYVWGGTSLTNGCDCSGFVLSVYANFGVSLPHSSASLRSVGYGVSASDMQLGDIVCYSGHVGIYAGNGQIVNAIDSAHGIGYSNAYYSNILAVRRIF